MIEFRDVSKVYSNRTVVDHINLKIEDGDFFGLLGPNGAGKTTIIRMLTSLTPSDSGDILIDGMKVARNEIRVKAKIGIVSQYLNLERELTARQNLELHGRLFGMEKTFMNNRIDELLEFIGLDDRQNDYPVDFSGGMKRKLMIARAILHKPHILVMDEPTVGLDVSARRKLWDMMRRLNSENMTIILTTHYIEEAEQLCNKVGFFNNGKLIALDTTNNLLIRAGKYAVEGFDDEKGITKSFYCNSHDEALKIAAKFKMGANVRQVNLEDVFMTLTNRRVGE